MGKTKTNSKKKAVVSTSKPKREKITYQEFCKRLLYARTHPYTTEFENLDLSCMNLSNLDLTGVWFNNVDFSDSSFYYTKMSSSQFRNCIFDRTNFRHSNLTYAIFTCCRLNNADFWYTNLQHATLCECHATNKKDGKTSFYRCDLSSATLYGNEITNISFELSSLVEARITRNTFINPEHMIPLVCPSHGSFTAFKKVQFNGTSVIAKIQIPASAKRSSSTGRKCRASEAKVLGFYDYEGKRLSKEKVPYAFSLRDRKFKYVVGETVRPKIFFDENRWKECASGIHFFVTFQEAVEYGPN